MKEYEKLLQENENRKNMQKALNLIKLGLFNQEEVAEFNFENKELITFGKKYKGLYDLYEDQVTGELVLVYPLVENNKNDEKYELDLKPYAYNVISLEQMTEEEYQDVLKAGTAVKTVFISILYKAEMVLLFATLVATLCYWGQSIFNEVKAGTNFAYALYLTIIPNSVNFFSFLAIQIGCLVISTVVYRNYKNK